MVEAQLREILDHFHDVRHPCILNMNGDVVASLDPVSVLPTEYEAFVMSLTDLSQGFLSIFTSRSARKIRLRGINRNVFFIYSINEKHILIFYATGHETDTFVPTYEEEDKLIQPILQALNTELLSRFP